VIEIRYVGTTKDHGGDERTALGWCNGEWSVVFPESVLRAWFYADDRPDDGLTLYAKLGVSRQATSEEVKAAYRRLARQWHPDVCGEPDAAEQFMALKTAYNILGDPMKRARYDAGLQLAQTIQTESRVNPLLGYRPPLRCGLLLVEGSEVLGRFVVSCILSWADIRDSQGRVLVTSWAMGADAFTEEWR
jgi:hypothetical protein